MIPLIQVAISKATLDTFIRVFTEYCKNHPEDEFAQDLKSKLIYTNTAVELETLLHDTLEEIEKSIQASPESKIILN